MKTEDLNSGRKRRAGARSGVTRGRGTSFCLGLVLTAWLAQAGAVHAAGAPAPATPAPANSDPVAALSAPIPQSIFVVPTSPKDGRNPFLPRSNINPSDPKSRPASPDTSAMVLNGLSSPPRPTAMINGRTFEPGESGEVRLPTGARIRVQCLEIRSDAVLVQVGSQRCELRLRRAL